ncbi:hypothetical protein LV478_02055 (plasmid) [Komagataeibacter oboediens]|uniref:hypothetical protein n=1 Tax=Komagataeibacter oboediens TaxID=65958 RepID=UPI0023DB9F55|nr:hypothetical protein [Komagataeibacter oboediens]WEQ50805.1 hypothetical protein LV478_02055 [Komagataeibacter oboediens]
MRKELTVFEKMIIKEALLGDKPWLLAMREQVPFLSVNDRTYTGVGFYTDINCDVMANPVDIPRNPDNGMPIDGYPPTVQAQKKGIRDSMVTFIVWLDENGRISLLEGCSLTDDTWPTRMDGAFENFSKG